jgi:hypothetical protein
VAIELNYSANLSEALTLIQPALEKLRQVIS